MKKIVLVCFLAGLSSAYLYLLWQRQSSLTVIHSPKKNAASSIETFSFSEAPKDTLRGTVASMSGTVNWTSRTATGPAMLTPQTVLQQGEEVETGDDGDVSLEFSNNGSVTLTPETNIQIVQTLPSRIMYIQTKGRAFYLSGSAPVSVRSFNLLVLLQQGEMAVSTDVELGEVTVENIKGRLSLAFNSLEYESNTVSLSEGERYVFNDTTREGTTVE